MGLHPQTIGGAMPHGYAGSYARQPDMIVTTRPAGAEIVFGAAVKYDAAGAVVPLGLRGCDFVGIDVTLLGVGFEVSKAQARPNAPLTLRIKM